MWDATLAKSQAAREGQRLDVNPEVTAQAAPSRDPWVEAGPAQPSTARSAPGNWKLKRDGASRSEKRRCRRKGPRPVDLGQLLCSGEPEVKRAHRVSCCLQSVTEKRVRDRACLSTAALYTNVETQKLLKTGMKAHEHSCSAKVLPHSQPATGARRPNPTFCRDCQGRGLTWLCMSADRNSNFALQAQADLRMRWRTRPPHAGLTIPKGQAFRSGQRPLGSSGPKSGSRPWTFGVIPSLRGLGICISSASPAASHAMQARAPPGPPLSSKESGIGPKRENRPASRTSAQGPPRHGKTAPYGCSTYTPPAVAFPLC